MFGVLEQVIIMLFSLHLGEPLVIDLCNAIIHKSSIHLFFIMTFSSSSWLLLLSSYHAGNLLILNTVCSGFSFFLGIFMFFFSSWVHGVSYRFHSLEVPLLPFIIGSWIWMDNQEYFKDSLRRSLPLRLNWTHTVFHGCYHGYICFIIFNGS